MSEPRKTFVGSGFGTLVVSNGGPPAPPVVSARRLLRDALPAAYYPADVLMRFLEGLERINDPIFALLDGLHAHFSTDVAPQQLVGLMAAWLSVDLDERQSAEQRRAALRQAAELWRRRGTRAGLELALALALPDLKLRIEDEGGVTWTRELGKPPRRERRQSHFVVYADRRLSLEEKQAVIACIDEAKPVHVAYRVRVRIGDTKETDA